MSVVLIRIPSMTSYLSAENTTFKKNSQEKAHLSNLYMPNCQDITIPGLNWVTLQVFKSRYLNLQLQ